MSVALDSQRREAVSPPRAVLVNAMADGMDLTEQLGELRRYDWHVIHGIDEAYSLIQALHPDLVVLSMSIDDQSGCRLMSMLHLDDRTAGTPIVIYAAVEFGSLQHSPVRLN